MSGAWKIVFPSIVKEDVDGARAGNAVCALAARRRVKLGL